MHNNDVKQRHDYLLMTQIEMNWFKLNFMS